MRPADRYNLSRYPLNEIHFGLFVKHITQSGDNTPYIMITRNKTNFGEVKTTNRSTRNDQNFHTNVYIVVSHCCNHFYKFQPISIEMHL